MLLEHAVDLSAAGVVTCQLTAIRDLDLGKAVTGHRPPRVDIGGDPSRFPGVCRRENGLEGKVAAIFQRDVPVGAVVRSPGVVCIVGVLAAMLATGADG
jgi:hypothetical protein